MSTTIIPEADPERLFELEESDRTDELRDLATQTLEEAEITREYDLSYEASKNKNSVSSGTHFSPAEVSPYYTGPQPDIKTPIESNVDEFYANLDGEFRLVDENGDDRTYKLVMSCDEGMLLRGEVGFGEREITEFRYSKGFEETNQLQVYIDGNWCKFGEAEKIGEGNQTMKHIELVESAYRQLEDASRNEKEGDWDIVYSSKLEEDLDELPPQVESTLENKSDSFEQNLGLGMSPQNMFKAMTAPWKPLLEMNLGNSYRAIFIESSHIPEDRLPENAEGNRNLIALSARPKNELDDNFRTNPGRKDSGNIRTNGLNYALNLLER